MKNKINIQAIIFLALIIALLLILFSIGNTLEKINDKISNNKKISGNAISENEFNSSESNKSNKAAKNSNDDSEYKKSELGETKSKMIYFLMIIGIIATIFIVGITLRSTIIENIKKEEEERRL